MHGEGVWGKQLADGRILLSLLEALYLVEKEQIVILNGNEKLIAPNMFAKRIRKLERDFDIRYTVFSDLRDKGYVVKTALKFGGDFRVYDKGIKPGEDHARWVVFAVPERTTLTWRDFAAKNRVAHSTRKALLLAIIDDEGDVSYWESRWTKP